LELAKNLFALSLGAIQAAKAAAKGKETLGNAGSRDRIFAFAKLVSIQNVTHLVS
jgi:hypothetical protein